MNLMIGAVALLMAGYFFAAYTVLVFIGFLPTIAASVADTEQEKYLVSSVGLCNICGVVPFLSEIYQDRMSVLQVLMLLQNPMTLFIMFASAGVGWVLYIVIPHVVRGALTSKAHLRIQILNRRLKGLEKIWGNAIEKPTSTKKPTID